MGKKIIFDTQAEKDEAIAKEKELHPTPNENQKEHLAYLQNAKVGE